MDESPQRRRSDAVECAVDVSSLILDDYMVWENEKHLSMQKSLLDELVIQLEQNRELLSLVCDMKSRLRRSYQTLRTRLLKLSERLKQVLDTAGEREDACRRHFDRFAQVASKAKTSAKSLESFRNSEKIPAFSTTIVKAGVLAIRESSFLGARWSHFRATLTLHSLTLNRVGSPTKQIYLCQLSSCEISVKVDCSAFDPSRCCVIEILQSGEPPLYVAAKTHASATEWVACTMLARQLSSDSLWRHVRPLPLLRGEISPGEVLERLEQEEVPSATSPEAFSVLVTPPRQRRQRQDPAIAGGSFSLKSPEGFPFLSAPLRVLCRSRNARDSSLQTLEAALKRRELGSWGSVLVVTGIAAAQASAECKWILTFLMSEEYTTLSPLRMEESVHSIGSTITTRSSCSPLWNDDADVTVGRTASASSCGKQVSSPVVNVCQCGERCRKLLNLWRGFHRRMADSGLVDSREPEEELSAILISQPLFEDELVKGGVENVVLESCQGVEAMCGCPLSPLPPDLSTKVVWCARCGVELAKQSVILDCTHVVEDRKCLEMAHLRKVLFRARRIKTDLQLCCDAQIGLMQHVEHVVGQREATERRVTALEDEEINLKALGTSPVPIFTPPSQTRQTGGGPASELFTPTSKARPDELFDIPL